MPDVKTKKKAQRDMKEGKSPSTAAGEFVREEIHHIREGRHGARNTRQAIAIGLSEARRAGVPLKPGARASKATRAQARKDAARAGKRVSAKRSKATLRALRKEPRSPASHDALSRQAKSAARRRRKPKPRRAAA